MFGYRQVEGELCLQKVLKRFSFFPLSLSFLFRGGGGPTGGRRNKREEEEERGALGSRLREKRNGGVSGRRGNKLEKDAKRLAYYEGCDTPI